MEKVSGFTGQDSGARIQDSAGVRHPERSEGSQPNVDILRSAQDDINGTADARTLFIGYGNPYRRDDGVAFHIMNAVRARLGRPPLAQDDPGEDDLGHGVDTVMAHQLVPELAPLLRAYERVVFLDAHAGSIPDAVRLIRVEPDGAFQATTHHFGPGLLLHLALQESGRCPEAFLLSVRGYDFDFGDVLSDACRANADAAAEQALELCGGVRPRP